VNPLSPLAIEVRPPRTNAEIDAYFNLAAATFPGYHHSHCTPTPGGNLASGWRRFNEEAPGFQLEYLRGAFVNGTFAGGYIHDEWWLRLPDASLRTGYVGGVVADPALRRAGIASALMRDGIAYASARGQTLLVLRGIADFYGRFGYGDVMEVTEHVVDRQLLAQRPAPGVRLRPASIDDAPDLLALYERHYYPFVGSYARTIEQQRHLLRHRTRMPQLALQDDGRPCGYVFLPCGADPSLAVEVAADSWPAALALLHFHADAAGSSSELRWPLPFGSPTYHHLADNLPLTSRTTSRPNAGWLARTANVNALLVSLLPLLQKRWRHAETVWEGPLILDVEGTRWCFEFSGSDLRHREVSPDGAPFVRLSSGALAQLVFGCRPAGWVTNQADQTVPADVVALLATLFPTTSAWYPGSNRC
jgi:GNAT superfamily N-acetyltransferase